MKRVASFWIVFKSEHWMCDIGHQNGTNRKWLDLRGLEQFGPSGQRASSGKVK
jgi:hypothetical protein